MEIPDGYVGLLFARSGIAIKKGLRPANAVGVIDSDYRGEIIVALHNDSSTAQYVNPGDRVAQLVIVKYFAPSIKDVLRKLSEDEIEDVRWEVSKNPNCPKDVLRKIFGKKDKQNQEDAFLAMFKMHLLRYTVQCIKLPGG